MLSLTQILGGEGGGGDITTPEGGRGAFEAHLLLLRPSLLIFIRMFAIPRHQRQIWALHHESSFLLHRRAPGCEIGVKDGEGIWEEMGNFVFNFTLQPSITWGYSAYTRETVPDDLDHSFMKQKGPYL